MVKKNSALLALTTLCENPQRRTGLTTFFHELVNSALKLYPHIDWLIFTGPTEDWPQKDERLHIIRSFPANDQLLPRLWADHFKVPVIAKQMGADALLTVGFVPIKKTLPTIMTLNSLQHTDPSNRIGRARQLYRRFMTQSGMARADLLITNSASAASQIKAVFPKYHGAMIVSHEGLQANQFFPETNPGESAELTTQFGIKPGFFLWVSNFYFYKQAELLLEGYSRLEEELRSMHPLVMVGGGWDGGDLSALTRARALGIESNVHFLGWVEERWLAPLYRNAIGFCLASREETFGRIVVEAMACGTPCVLNDIPIMHEVTAGSALIIDFRNSNEVATGLSQIALDRHLHEQLRVKGLHRASEFSFDKMTRERMDAILELLNKGKG